jgi:hypothetical protein
VKASDLGEVHVPYCCRSNDTGTELALRVCVGVKQCMYAITVHRFRGVVKFEPSLVFGT